MRLAFELDRSRPRTRHTRTKSPSVSPDSDSRAASRADLSQRSRVRPAHCGPICSECVIVTTGPRTR